MTGACKADRKLRRRAVYDRHAKASTSIGDICVANCCRSRYDQGRLGPRPDDFLARGLDTVPPSACIEVRACIHAMVRRFYEPGTGAKTLQIFVRDNNVEQALRILKKKMQREGVFREMKRRRYYEKPSERTTREKAEAARRARKLARKQAVRDGLIAAPRNKRIGSRRGTLKPSTPRTGSASTPRTGN